MQHASLRNQPLVEWRPGVLTRLHAASSAGSEQLCVLEQVCAPGTGAPRHRHEGVEEVVVLVEGQARFFAGEERADLAAGESILVPPGVWHGFTNVGEDLLRVLAVFSSAAPPIEYEGEAHVLEIGGVAGRRRDAHRVYRDEA